jgi:sec-independent protein translocase protein TatC
MNPSDEQKGTSPQAGEVSGSVPEKPLADPAEPRESEPDGTAPAPSEESKTLARRPGGGGGKKPPPPKPPKTEDGDEEEDGMVRMSFLGHLEELRSRIIWALMGVAVAFGVSIFFSPNLWDFVCQPAVGALKAIGARDANLAQIEPMEAFNIIYFKLPVLCAIFLSSPWIVYQVWAFISPGLYKRERRWAAPFILIAAGLFILGGVFAYFVVFRLGLTFLLGLGMGKHVVPVVSMTEYFNLFVNVTLGVGLVFELPVAIFIAILLHLVTPKFLVTHSRYAILAIFLLAAIVTPTPDVFNMMLFAVPMCVLFYAGVFAGYLLVLQREKRRFPWGIVLTIVGILLTVLALVLYLSITRYGMRLVPHWPFIMK